MHKSSEREGGTQRYRERHTETLRYRERDGDSKIHRERDRQRHNIQRETETQRYR